jgi:hypothetical protein
MWNYLSGVKPPSESEKKKRKFESTKEYYKAYEKKNSPFLESFRKLYDRTDMF